MTDVNFSKVGEMVLEGSLLNISTQDLKKKLKSIHVVVR